MKYFTKEWYKIMQRTDTYVPLKTSKKAEKFSEKYYNELYKQEEKQWIKLQKEISNLTFKDIFPEHTYDNKLIEAKHKNSQMHFCEGMTFDLVQAKNKFSQLHKYNIKKLQQKLPPEILNKVADIRVLALDRATSSIKNEITAYCFKQKKLVQKALIDYQEYYDKGEKDDKCEEIQNLNLHDTVIKNIIKRKNKLIIELDVSEKNKYIKNITFQDYKIIEEELDFINGWCLYKEIYFLNNQYELHLLIDVSVIKKNVERESLKLGYFTIRAKNIILD